MKLEPGKLIVIAGPPAIGKSCLLMQIANANAQAGRRVLLIDLQRAFPGGRFRSDKRHRDPRVEVIRSPNMTAAELMFAATMRGPDVLLVDGAEGDCGDVLGSLAVSATMAIVATATTLENWPRTYGCIHDASEVIRLTERSDVVDVEIVGCGIRQQLSSMRLDSGRAKLLEIREAA